MCLFEMPILLFVFPVGWTFLSDHRLKAIPSFLDDIVLAISGFMNPALRDGQARMPILLLSHFEWSVR